MRRWRGPLAVAVLGSLGWLAGAPPAPAAPPHCDANDAGLSLPEGFCALEVARDAGPVRGLVVARNGDLIAALAGQPGGVLVLRDADGDGRAEQRKRFGEAGGHDVRLHEGFLYFAADRAVLRWPWKEGALEPAGPPQTLVSDFPAQNEHAHKAIALGPDGALYVGVGAPTNSCQRDNRAPGSPGLDPCPQLQAHAGIWKYDAARADQPHDPARRFATGMRHTLALAIHPSSGELWGAVNGRDLLGANWGYTAQRNAELPAEELVRVSEGADFGWPYCYHDGPAGRKVLAPEYGGDGQEVGRCADKARPALAFPAHWAPMSLLFYSAEQFPARYRGGAFVAFHGSWNRAPLPQEGYRIAFAPFEGEQPAGTQETFAIGAADPAGIRFVGLAVGPDGSLYASADGQERIWRIVYRGAPAATPAPE
jgi:glucose/arabinose dehydrogenase